MNNIIFLDVDGVLNNNDTTEHSPEGYIGVDSTLIENLQNLVKEFSATIILTSDWKREWEKDTSLCSVDALYLNKKLNEKDVYITDKTLDRSIGRDAYSQRGWGIHEYLKTHQVDNWVVLDDLYFSDFDTEIVEHFVKTQPCSGFDTNALEHAKQILSGNLNQKDIYIDEKF